MNNLDFNFFCHDCRHSIEYRKANCFTSYRVRRYKKGEIIALTGESVKSLGIVTNGSITVSFVLETGLIMRQVNHHSPYPIGAVALFSKESRYRVDIEAQSECEIISVPRSEIEERISNCREFMRSYIDYSTSKLDIFTTQLAHLTQRSIKAKLAYYILYSSNGREYRFTKSIKDLATYLCVERPSLSRVISQFVAEGLISYNDGAGAILNVARLKEYID